jgi:acid phosphatase
MFFTPNMNNDGHDTDIPTSSRWLKAFLEPKLVDPAYKDVLFVVTFDESKSYLTGGNTIYGLLLGAGIKGKGLVDNKSYDHYSYLSMIEKNFGLGNLGKKDVNATPIPLAAPVCTPKPVSRR